MLRTPKAEGSARPRMRCDMNKSVQSPCELFLSCLWGLRLQKLYLQWSCQADLHYPRCHLKISWISILFFFFKCQICSKVFYWEIKKKKKCIYDGCYPMRAEMGACCCVFRTSLKVIFASNYLCPGAERSHCSLLLPGSSFGSQLNRWWLNGTQRSTGESPDPRKSHRLLYFSLWISGCEK